MLAETQKEAIRQDRSVSWIIQAAWRLARDEVRRMPASGMPAVPATAKLPEEPTLDPTTPLPQPQPLHGTGRATAPS
jgi:uncharacterized small protein (TIGR04563 family)